MITLHELEKQVKTVILEEGFTVDRIGINEGDDPHIDVDTPYSAIRKTADGFPVEIKNEYDSEGRVASELVRACKFDYIVVYPLRYDREDDTYYEVEYGFFSSDITHISFAIVVQEPIDFDHKSFRELIQKLKQGIKLEKVSS